jgi:hypothetical protein
MAYDLKGLVYALDVPLNSLKPPRSSANITAR